MNLISTTIYSFVLFCISNVSFASEIYQTPAPTDKAAVLHRFEEYADDLNELFEYPQILNELDKAGDETEQNSLMKLSVIIINALTAGFVDLAKFEFILDQMNGIHDPESLCREAECIGKEDKMGAGDDSKIEARQIVDELKKLIEREKEILIKLLEDDPSVRENYFENVLFRNFSDFETNTQDLEALLVLFIEKYVSMISELILRDETSAPSKTEMNELGMVRWQVLRIRMYIDQRYMDSKINELNFDTRPMTLKPSQLVYHDGGDIGDCCEEKTSVLPSKKPSAIKVFNNHLTNLLLKAVEIQRAIFAVEKEKDSVSVDCSMVLLGSEAKDSGPNREKMRTFNQAHWQKIRSKIKCSEQLFQDILSRNGISLDISSEHDTTYHMSYFFPIPHSNLDASYMRLVRKYFNEVDNLVSSSCGSIESFSEQLLKDLLSQIYMARRLIDGRDRFISGIESLRPEVSGIESILPETIVEGGWVMIDSKDENVKKG